MFLTRHCCKQTTITKSQHVCCKHRYVIICTHLITFVHIQCTSVITIIHTCDRQNQHCKLRRKKSCVDAAILCKGASSACLSLSSKAQACQQVIESLKALQRKSGTAQAKSTSSLCTEHAQKRQACVLDLSSKSL